MAQYEGTFACGHAGIVNVIGPMKDRPYKIEYKFSQLCPKCFEIEKERNKNAVYEQAVLDAKELNLPDLEGSEKQVRWAIVLRSQMIARWEKTLLDKKLAERRLYGRFYQSFEDAEKAREMAKLFIESDSFIDWLKAQRKASFYINNRELNFQTLIVDNFREIIEFNDEIAQAAKDEAVIYPDNCSSNNLCEIDIVSNEVKLKSDYDPKITVIAHDMNMRWDSDACKWSLKIDITTGQAIDRAAELANKILREGFPVRLMDEEAKEKAVAGTFEPLYLYWIFSQGEKIRIEWRGKNTKIYDTACKIPSAKYRNGGITVSPKYFAEIEDFAQLFQFRLSPGAERELAKARASFEAANRVQPAAVEKKLSDSTAKHSTAKHSTEDLLKDLADD